MSIPGAANPLLLATAAAGGYEISRSLRFNSSDSAYLSRTPASAGNRKTWTWAGWVKRTGLDGTRYLFDDNGVTSTSLFIFSDKIYVQLNGLSGRCVTNAVFRDPSAWFHIVWAVDTTQSTAANRNRLYVNGVEQTFSSAAYPSQNTDTGINAASLHQIGYSFDGYLADVHLIDSQALDPSSFTEVSATTGQLIPKAYTGSFGTNGFWLKFSDNSAATATTLGKDYSGNSNNWTPNNLSVTAGAGNDSLVDTPTSYGTDTGAGGEVRGNYCTWNPLFTNSAFTISNGNLDLATSSVSDRVCASTFGLSSGKWYWEITFNSGAGVGIGVCTSAVNLASYLGGTSASRSYDWDGKKYPGATSYGASYTTGDVIGVAVDIDAGTLVYYKNGVSQGTAFSDLAGSTWFPAIGDQSSSGNVAISANFGQRPFAYTAPSGFKALCDTNLPAPVVAKSSDYFQTVLYTGTGSNLAVTGLNFSPDLIWTKARSAVDNHILVDQIRGVGNILLSNSTQAETAYSAFTSFDSNGFTKAAAESVNGRTYVAWCFDAGTTTTTNTQGSITSSVRANASSGFSVVTYPGALSGAGSSTIGHGLGVAPSLVIVKNRDAAENWVVYHQSLGNAAYVVLNSTSAQVTGSSMWGTTSPTSSVFTAGYSSQANLSGNNYVAYCFAPVAGYSSFGSYTGNGSTDGPFVFTGMRPRWIMIKKSSAASAVGWYIYDSSRDTYNLTKNFLAANSSAAEVAAGDGIDILSNGFKLRATGTDINDSGQTFVWAAFAESPFQYARAR